MDNLKDKKENQILKNIIIASVSILTVLLLIIIWNAIAPFQSDNDNIYLRTIVSGEMTGNYESHLYYMGIISGVILSALYTITGNVIHWFGIFLCASMASTMCAILYVSLKKCKQIYSIIILYVFHVIIFISFFYHYFAKTQFTIATGMVGVTALFCLAVVKFEEKLSKSIIACIPFLIFSIWSLGMRDKGFFMLIPFFGMVFLAKLIDAKEKKAKLNVVITGLIFLAVIGSVFGINKLAYSSDEWKEFKAYTDASEELIDYYGFPDYDENEKEYEKYGITKSSYEAAVYHYNIILDSSINKDSMISLAKVAKANCEKNSEALPLRLIGILKEIVYRNIKDYQDRPINIVVFALYAFVFV